MSHYINGRRRTDSSIGATTDVIDPSNGELIERLPLAGPAEVDEAVAAAAAAFPGWSKAAPVERSTALLKWAAILEDRAEEFARVESRQAGKPIRLTR
ncbi:MAG: aldehyde dehydrogenase family protein, partial [Micropruina sp.]